MRAESPPICSIGHFVLSEHFQLFPSIPHTVGRNVGGVAEIIIPKLVPEERITVSFASVLVPDVQPGSVRETSPPRSRLDPFGSSCGSAIEARKTRSQIDAAAQSQAMLALWLRL
jgi:hypothetical protein